MTDWVAKADDLLSRKDLRFGECSLAEEWEECLRGLRDDAATSSQILNRLLGWCAKDGCTCTFPTTDCCPYAEAETHIGYRTGDTQ